MGTIRKSFSTRCKKGSRISKEDYAERVPQLRVDLINAQYDLKSAGFPVLILISGDDRVGANEVVNVLHEWMDARYMHTRVFGRPTDEELERPRFWRYGRLQLEVPAPSCGEAHPPPATLRIRRHLT